MKTCHIGEAPSMAYLRAMETQRKQPITVYYDGDCPVCQMEISYYRRIQNDESIDWIDILNLSDKELPGDKTRHHLLGKFHVRENDDAWHVGVDAFARIWENLPGWRHFAFLFRVPGIRQLAGVAYRVFLNWQRWHRRRREARRHA